MANDFTVENGGYDTSNTVTSTDLNKGINDIANQADQLKQKATQAASGLSQQVSEQVDKASKKVSTMTHDVNDKATRSIDRISMYIKEKDSQEMVDDLNEVIKKHPGKSVIAGLVLGVLIGKILR